MESILSVQLLKITNKLILELFNQVIENLVHRFDLKHNYLGEDETC